MASELSSPKSARAICEALLRAERNDKIEKARFPNDVKVIDQLLARGLELNEAYEELCNKLYDHTPALWVFFDLLQSTAAFWSPEANVEARKGKTRLIEVNRRIEETATELASLLSERTELKNLSGFSCGTHYHPVDVIHAAAEKNYSYQQWVKHHLEYIRYQFDLKYWPSLSEFVQAIAEDAARAMPQPQDAVTQAGTEGSRAGLADSFKAFFVVLEESSTRNHGFLPNKFNLTDSSMASLMNCALNLGPEDAVDSSYVKRLRQRKREQASRA